MTNIIQAPGKHFSTSRIPCPPKANRETLLQTASLHTPDGTSFQVGRGPGPVGHKEADSVLPSGTSHLEIKEGPPLP